MKNILLFILLFLISCSTIEHNGDFDIYKNNFAKEYKIHTGNKISDDYWKIPIVFIDSFGEDSLVIGICYMNSSTIFISKKMWKTYENDLSKEYIIFHELGHCFLKIEKHTNGFSIMGAHIMNIEIYKHYRKSLLNYLFTTESQL